jgi:hypothetical protein
MPKPKEAMFTSMWHYYHALHDHLLFDFGCTKQNKHSKFQTEVTTELPIHIEYKTYIKFTERLDYYILVINDQSLLTGPLLRICQWRGHQEKGTQLGGGKREKWELVWPRKILSVCRGLIFGIFRHNYLYISSARQRFGDGNTKILFLTKLFFPFCLYLRQKRASLGRGTTQFTGGAKTGTGGTSSPVYGIFTSNNTYIILLVCGNTTQIYYCKFTWWFHKPKKLYWKFTDNRPLICKLYWTVFSKQLRPKYEITRIVDQFWLLITVVHCCSIFHITVDIM